MSEAKLLPAWAEDLRRRYLRGEASMFVLHGNVFDAVVHQQRTLTITSFLTDVLLKDSRQTVAVYNLATGVRFVRREAGGPSFEDALLATEKPKALAALERALVGASKVAVILEYAEAIAPAGDPAFQADSDRAAIITLQRWSFLPEVDRSDNLVLLVAENLSELSPKLVSNPKVGVVEVPMPDVDARRAAIRQADAKLTDKDVDRYAEVTAGLKAIQIASILAPPPASEGDARDREAFIAGILTGSADAEARARKLGALTVGL
jgi:transitional endoplasmic reticulum ATPase